MNRVRHIARQHAERRTEIDFQRSFERYRHRIVRSLLEMTTTTLRQVAKDAGIKRHSVMTRNQLIAKIANHRARLLAQAERMEMLKAG